MLQYTASEYCLTAGDDRGFTGLSAVNPNQRRYNPRRYWEPTIKELHNDNFWTIDNVPKWLYVDSEDTKANRNAL